MSIGNTSEPTIDFQGMLVNFPGSKLFGGEEFNPRGENTQVFWKRTLPETNISPLKMDGWNTIVSF